MSLYRICSLKVAIMLKRGFWCSANGSQACNPFSFLPSNVVDELASLVVKLSPPGSLKITDLYYLLTSRRIEHFKLDSVRLSTEELVAILMSLSVASQNLRSLRFREVKCFDPYSRKAEEALECLLRVSPRLESLVSCISFDLKAIRNCKKLKALGLNFLSYKPLYSFLEEENGNFSHNYSLSILEFVEDFMNRVPYLDLVPILKYCAALTHISGDISRSLEFLHSDELYDGTLTTQYKLQKCLLGNIFRSNGAANHIVLHIATLTCPDLREADILANDNKTIYALSDFKNLSSLLIQWELTNGGNFQLGLQPVLEKIGSNLKRLDVVNFFHIDFAAIATMCPDIEFLKVEYQSEYQGYDRPLAGFQHLKSLVIEASDLDFGCSEETLVMLLSNCNNLTILSVFGAQNLNDRILNQILVKNKLSNLEEIILIKCNLSEDGIRNLVSHLSSLEFFHFNCSQVPFEVASAIVHEVKPHVRLF